MPKKTINLKIETHERLMDLRRQKNLQTPYNTTIDMVINELLDIVEGKED